jgi:hypothetical protein
MAQLHGPRRNSAMEPVSEPAVAEMSRPVPARTALSFSRASVEGPRIKKDRVDPSSGQAPSRQSSGRIVAQQEDYHSW